MLTRQRASRGLHKAGAQAYFSRGAYAATGAIDVRDITLSERPRHPSRRSGVVRGHEQVDVMGHQYECMNAAALPSQVILEPVRIKAIVIGPV